MTFFAGPIKEEPHCTRCGKCCHVFIDGKVVKCKRLVVLKSGKTLCRQYHNRIGTPIGGKYVCGFRETSCFNYPDCPYNSIDPDRPMAPEWRNKDE